MSRTMTQEYAQGKEHVHTNGVFYCKWASIPPVEPPHRKCIRFFQFFFFFFFKNNNKTKKEFFPFLQIMLEKDWWVDRTSPHLGGRTRIPCFEHPPKRYPINALKTEGFPQVPAGGYFPLLCKTVGGSAATLPRVTQTTLKL